LQSGISRYAGLIALAAAFAAAVIFRGKSLSDPLVRKELIFCSVAIAAAVVINWGIASLATRKIRTTVSYIGWILVSLSIALKMAAPSSLFDPGSNIGLLLVFAAGLIILLYAYLGGDRVEKTRH